MNNITAIQILTNLKESGFMGTSTKEALQYAIECIFYISRVAGANEQFEKIWRGEENVNS